MALGSLSEVDGMSMDDFYQFMIYDSMEPIGDHRSDIQTGTIAAAVYNVNRTKQEQPILNWSDILPKWAGPEPPPPDPERLRERFELIQAFQNAFAAVANEP